MSTLEIATRYRLYPIEIGIDTAREVRKLVDFIKNGGESLSVRLHDVNSDLSDLTEIHRRPSNGGGYLRLSGFGIWRKDHAVAGAGIAFSFPPSDDQYTIKWINFREYGLKSGVAIPVDATLTATGFHMAEDQSANSSHWQWLQPIQEEFLEHLKPMEGSDITKIIKENFPEFDRNIQPEFRGPHRYYIVREKDWQIVLYVKAEQLNNTEKELLFKTFRVKKFDGSYERTVTTDFVFAPASSDISVDSFNPVWTGIESKIKIWMGEKNQPFHYRVLGSFGKKPHSVVSPEKFHVTGISRHIDETEVQREI